MAVQIESKGKFAKKENAGLIGRFIFVWKILKDFQLYSESGGTEDRNGEGRGNEEMMT